MKQRAIYYRKKGKKIIAEGIEKGKTIYLFAIPSPEKLLNPSLFPIEKIEKIKEKIARLDFRKERIKKHEPKFHITKIIRTPKKDGKYLN